MPVKLESGELPNGSRLSCGRNADVRKVCRTADGARRRENATLPTRAPAGFKRLLGSRPHILLDVTRQARVVSLSPVQILPQRRLDLEWKSRERHTDVSQSALRL